MAVSLCSMFEEEWREKQKLKRWEEQKLDKRLAVGEECNCKAVL